MAMLEKSIGWSERSEGLDRWGHRVKPVVAPLVGRVDAETS